MFLIMNDGHPIPYLLELLTSVQDYKYPKKKSSCPA